MPQKNVSLRQRASESNLRTARINNDHRSGSAKAPGSRRPRALLHHLDIIALERAIVIASLHWLHYESKNECSPSPLIA